jgi:hypothetical protein
VNREAWIYVAINAIALAAPLWLCADIDEDKDFAVRFAQSIRNLRFALVSLLLCVFACHRRASYIFVNFYISYSTAFFDFVNTQFAPTLKHQSAPPVQERTQHAIIYLWPRRARTDWHRTARLLRAGLRYNTPLHVAMP